MSVKVVKTGISISGGEPRHTPSSPFSVAPMQFSIPMFVLSDKHSVNRSTSAKAKRKSGHDTARQQQQGQQRQTAESAWDSLVRPSVRPTVPPLMSSQKSIFRTQLSQSVQSLVTSVSQSAGGQAAGKRLSALADPGLDSSSRAIAKYWNFPRLKLRYLSSCIASVLIPELVSPL